MIAALWDWLFSTDPFVPHGVCVLWRPDLVWTHVVADSVIALAYFTIPLFLVALVRGRSDVKFTWVFHCFAAFILLCGATHVFDIISFFVPLYGLEAAVKIATALASVATAIMVWPLLPKLLALPSQAALKDANARLEERVAERTADLEKANAQLTMLMHEVLHRTKNNLAVVASMLRLAQRRVGDDQARDALDQVVGRVDAMGLVHQELYGGGRIADMDLGSYLAKLIQTMRDADPRAAGADIRLDADATSVDIDHSVPVALIIHEALVNALEHGAPATGQPRIGIVVRSDAGRTTVEVVDAGPGSGAEATGGGGAGLRIVDALARQIDGGIELRRGAEGTRFILTFAQAPRVARDVALRPSNAGGFAAVQPA